MQENLDEAQAQVPLHTSRLPFSDYFKQAMVRTAVAGQSDPIL